MCIKVVKISMKDMGVVGKAHCRKPEFKNGLCHDHYKRQQQKLVNWENRAGYRDVTIDEFNRGCSLKMKGTHVHVIYRYNKGIIQKNKQDVWYDTDIVPDHNLFVKKS